LTHALWDKDPPAVQGVVVLAVVEFLANAAVDLEVKLGGNGHVSRVKQAVNVAPEKQAAGRLMCGAIPIGADVCRLQGGQGSLPRDRTGISLSL
jgi:hypothetical protein